MEQPIYLVRHGESEWNLARRTQGQTAHPPLTGEGRRQARAAAAAIAADLARADGSVARVLTSDLVRARQTAEIVAAALGSVPETAVGLREQHLGELEGRPQEESWAAAAVLDWTVPGTRVAGGESLDDVHRRVAALLAGVDRAEVTVLVSHGDAIRVALAHLRGDDPHRAPWVPVANGAVARVDSGGSVRWLDPVRTGHSVLAAPAWPLEDFVRRRTERYDASFVSTDPVFAHAHVTVLGPWLSLPTHDDLAAVGDVVRTEPAFEVTLSEVRAFPDGVLYLGVDPAAPFSRLTAALARRFPETPPYAGAHPDPVPHLTLEHLATGATVASVQAELADVLPVRLPVEQVDLQWWDNDDCHVRGSWRLGR